MKALIVSCIGLIVSNLVLASVEFNPFYIEGTEQQIEVIWMTFSETNNDHFEIARSDSENGEFELIGTKPGWGTTTSSHLYHFNDTTVVLGQTYWYLMTDVDSQGVRNEHTEWIPSSAAPVVWFHVFESTPECPEGYLITWTTRYEFGVASFIIGRRPWTGGPGFEPVGFVQSQGNSPDGWSYEFHDWWMDPVIYQYYLTAEDSIGRIWDPLWMSIPEPPSTGVQLDEFMITSTLGAVTLEWTTRESNVRCYRVWRSLQPGGVNENIMAFHHCDEGPLCTYHCLDSLVHPGSEYRYQIEYTDIVYESHILADTVMETAISSATDISLHPKEFILASYPNPFNPTTTIELALPQTGDVHLAVYNIQGQQVAELVNGVTEAGTHKVALDGSAYPSGLYFAQLRTKGYQRTHKLMLIK